VNYLDYAISMPYGSQLYGTATAESDLDILTLYCESEADLFARRYPKIEQPHVNAQIEVDEKFMSLGQFVHLLAKGDPHWSPIALQYPELNYLTELLVSAHTVGRMISMSHAQARDESSPKQRAHGFRTALAAFDLFTTGEVRYPLNEADREAYHAIRNEEVHGASQTFGITEILTDIKITTRLRKEPNFDLAAEETMRIYQQAWELRRL
jgi:hypothetical protein